MNGKQTYKPNKRHLSLIPIERIQQADDYGDVFELAFQLNVDLEGLDDLEDMKTRLILFRKKCEGEPNYKDVIRDAMVEAGKEDKRRRNKLIELLTQTREKLAPFTVNDAGEKVSRRGSAVIAGFLKSEGTIQNLDSEIEQKLELVQNGYCTVVVSGETSAGKSSILNLLFGEEVLPTFHGSCTSVITRVKYHKQRKAILTYKNDKTEKIEDIMEGEICKRLEPYLFVKDETERDKATTIKEVAIYLPAKILECGLSVVDSPGIGENLEMDKVIMNFVGENQINAFLYAIKSDNAGGVDEDRLLELLKLILDKEKEKTERGMLPFDPSCAMFVCNMWDCIEEDQDEMVFNYAYQKLKTLWPNMKESQMLKFSAFKAKKECEMDPDFIIDMYKNLLNRIGDLYSKATDNRIISTYKWLENILKRSVHHLKTIVHRIDSSDKDLESKMRTIWGKLQTLKMKSELIIKELRDLIDEKTNEICEDFRLYLLSPSTRMSITTWHESELPEEGSYNSMNELKEYLKNATLSKISKELESWEEELGKMAAVKAFVQSQIQSNFDVLEGELQEIEDDMQSDTESINEEIAVDRSRRRLSIPVGSIQLDISRMTLPVKLANRVLKPFGGIGNIIFGKIDTAISEGKLKEYKNDPKGYAKKQSFKTLELFARDKKCDHLKTILNSFMTESKRFLEDLRQKIPAMIETNHKMIDHITLSRSEGVSTREMYEQMMEQFELLKRTLSDYGEGYIFVNDFGVDDIQIATDSEEGAGERTSVPLDVSTILEDVETSAKKWSQRQIPRSLFAAQQVGILVNKNKEESVTIKIYLPSSKIQNTDSEVAKLRLMTNEHVAEFLGIQHTAHPTPAFVFAGNLRSLGRYLNNRLVPVKEDIPRILKEVLSGLDYIHRKGMVHMELNINTITIDDNAKVKLCGACRPKHVALPDDKDVVLVGDFVYISPETLNGNTYVATADIYAFGLLIFEILVTQPFQSQRRWPLASFIENCQPNAFIGCPYAISHLLKSTQEAIQDCLNITVDRRPSIESLVTAVEELKDDQALNELKERRRNNPMSRALTESSPCYDALRISRSNALLNRVVQSPDHTALRKSRSIASLPSAQHSGVNPLRKSLSNAAFSERLSSSYAAKECDVSENPDDDEGSISFATFESETNEGNDKDCLGSTEQNQAFQHVHDTRGSVQTGSSPLVRNIFRNSASSTTHKNIFKNSGNSALASNLSNTSGSGADLFRNPPLGALAKQPPVKSIDASSQSQTSEGRLASKHRKKRAPQPPHNVGGLLAQRRVDMGTGMQQSDTVPRGNKSGGNVLFKLTKTLEATPSECNTEGDISLNNPSPDELRRS